MAQRNNSPRKSTLSDTLALIIGSVALAVTAFIIVFFSDVPEADAAVSVKQSVPYKCSQTYRAPDSDLARACRAKGWLIGPAYVVSPRHVLRYYNLPTCFHEDGSGQRRTCGWNVTEDNGVNGAGEVYLAFTNGPHRDDTFVALNQCSDSGCVPWVR